MHAVDSHHAVYDGSLLQGVAMTNNYGTKTSDELLLAYGFLLPHTNPADYFQVSLTHRRQQHLPPQQQLGQSAGNGACGMEEEMDCGEPMVQQQLAEDLQRAMTLSGLGLRLDHQLTLQQPLPPAFVQGAQLCLLPAPQLYMLTSQLLHGRLTRHASHAAGGGGDGSGAGPMAVDRQPCVRKRTGELAELSPRGDPAKESRALGSSDGGGKDECAQAGPSVPQGLLEAASAMRIRPSVPAGAGAGGAHVVPSAAAVAGGHHSSEAAGEGRPLLSLPKELEALVSLHQQLDSKLACMISDEEEEAALLSATQAAAAVAATCTGSCAAAPPAGKPQHTQLAITYLRGQKAIVRSSLAQLEQRASHVVQAAAEAATPVISNGSSAFTYVPLAPAHGCPMPCVPETAQPAGPRLPKWASIDPDVHVSQYNAWLRCLGLQPAAGASGDARLAGDDSTAVAAVFGPEPGSGKPSKGQCLLQEVTCHRQVGSGSTCGAVGCSGSSTDGPANGSGAAGRGGPGGRSGTRGPPSSSRTMRNLKSAMQPGGGPDASGPGGQPQQQQARPLKRVSMPQGVAAAIGVDSDHDPTVLGVRLARDVSAGSVVLEVPGECCFIATSRQQLVCALMASAHQLLDALLTAIAPHAAVALTRGAETAAATAGIAGAQVPLMYPVDMFAWHLLHCVGSSPANRLHVSDVDGVQLLLDMLEGECHSVCVRYAD